MTASENIHSKTLISVLHSPMTFFYTTPVGRLLNRYLTINYYLQICCSDSLRTCSLLMIRSTSVWQCFWALFFPLLALYEPVLVPLVIFLDSCSLLFISFLLSRRVSPCVFLLAYPRMVSCVCKRAFPLGCHF